MQRMSSSITKTLLVLAPQCIDDTFEIIDIPHIAPGVHEVTSDSGIGVYIYGYGFDESYAWGAPAQAKQL